MKKEEDRASSLRAGRGAEGVEFSDPIDRMVDFGYSTTKGEEKAERHNSGKPRLFFNVLGREVAELEASVWEFGANKYSPGNWLKGMPTSEAADSLIRHLTAYLNGEDKDPESGLLHLGHVITSAKILANSHLKGFDDRGER